MGFIQAQARTAKFKNLVINSKGNGITLAEEVYRQNSETKNPWEAISDAKMLTAEDLIKVYQDSLSLTSGDIERLSKMGFIEAYKEA